MVTFRDGSYETCGALVPLTFFLTGIADDYLMGLTTLDVYLEFLMLGSTDEGSSRSGYGSLKLTSFNDSCACFLGLFNAPDFLGMLGLFFLSVFSTFNGANNIDDLIDSSLPCGDLNYTCLLGLNYSNTR